MVDPRRPNGRTQIWSVFAAGIGGGLLLAGGGSTLRSTAPAGAVNVAGIDRPGQVVSGTEPMAMIPSTGERDHMERLGGRSAISPIPTTRPLEQLPHLTAQEVAKRAIQWTATIRGDGVYGSGIVVDPRGYVVTNHHVIQGVEHIRVSFVDEVDLPAKVVDVDKELDLALLKVETTRPTSAPAADFLDAEVGDDVYAVGNPRKMGFTVSRGMVSYIGRRIDGRYYLQSDLPTNDGNSGGPVVNDRGEAVGVMTFILRDSQGLAFAVPMNYVYERFSSHLKSERVDLARFTRWKSEHDAAATASR